MSHRCASCAREGAGMRYRHLYRDVWFHPRCWKVARMCDARFNSESPAARLVNTSENVVECGADVSDGQVQYAHITTRDELA